MSRADELAEHLEEQVSLLGDARKRFDEGFRPAYLQMAVVVRVLVHDTSKSHSLLGQLGTKEALLLPSRGVPIDVLVASPSLVSMELGRDDHGETIFRLIPHSRQECIDGAKSWIPFEDWWKQYVIKAGNKLFSRRYIVLSAANQLGGAHVDKQPPDQLRALMRENLLGWEIQDQKGSRPAGESAVPESIRTIAEELSIAMENLE